MMSSLIEHPEKLDFVEFDEVTENTPQDASVEIQRIGLTKAPLALQLVTVVETMIEAPIELLWLIKIDEMLYDALSNISYTPFNPAPIMENFQMEFNIMNVEAYQGYLNSLKSEYPIKTTHSFDYCRTKLMRGMMEYFHE